MRKSKYRALLLTALLTQVAYADTAAKCVSGDCANGQGTFIYGDGTKYVGESVFCPQ
jgi:hypothetical protein